MEEYRSGRNELHSKWFDDFAKGVLKNPDIMGFLPCSVPLSLIMFALMFAQNPSGV